MEKLEALLDWGGHAKGRGLPGAGGRGAAGQPF